MPYLNLENYDDFVHLEQLFFAAHPDERQVNEQVRAQAGAPSAYFLSAAQTRRLAAWARRKQLITRQASEQLLDLARYVYQEDPAQVVSLTPRLLGTPPRLQPSVRGSDIYRWLFCQEPDVSALEVVMTLEAAITLVAQERHRLDRTPQRDRAHVLLAWLKRQQAQA
jgi:hypothetical protein